jgi:fatty-acyl-CoA synthase
MRIVDLLERDAQLYADRSAVEIVGGTRLTYRELRDRVHRIAAGLAKRGLRRGDRVAVMGGNGLLFFDAYLAAAYLGAAAVPLNSRLAPPEIAYQLAHSEPSLALADAIHAEQLVTGLPTGVEMLVAGTPEYTGLLSTEVPNDIAERAEPGDVALVIYTSGTTGRPKGVCLSQAALAFNGVTVVLAQRLPPGEVFLSTTPLYHGATGTRITSMLLDGQCHVVMGSFDAGEFLDIVERHRVNSTILVPTQLRRVLDAQAASPRNLDTLRLLVYGAAPTATPIIRRAMAELDCGLYQGYGLSEACTNLTGLLPEDHTPEADTAGLLASCGRAVPGVQVRIGEQTGGVGEIQIRTDKVMNGYWRDPEATAAAIPDGWLRTGDLGRLDGAGYLFIVDRAKDMIISGGVNIYPSEIEAVLHEHPLVAEATVIGIPDEEWGETPVAYVIKKANATLDESAVIAFCAERLARFKVPHTVTFVGDFPRTASGKVRKVELRAAGAR